MKVIEKALRDAANNNSVKCGTKEVMKSIKGSNLIVISKSIDNKALQYLEEHAVSMGIKIYQFEGNSMQLGKYCGKPFRTSVVSIKSDQI
ncbi:ribosomal L7Ae/L30e/S12e/Gadd45 family protein [Nitrososphaera sp. AFS]|jgi:large subunit ribosomal protein L30e|uniref:ribosomal L7Ae/L30e/S12e/Gadd45 family protein n=1 Tax=Nitrososphaera sp. AFS TaxID=2301191 RepID=UPI0013923B3E|nr:ribosomal L7Ae/L30e/S12e/Gadd45 family protein [Nitrososphaera sp. AFS]NAL76647.1 50S ribosomal protein L7ae [Nitrososphaera sp. AFS]